MAAEKKKSCVGRFLCYPVNVISGCLKAPPISQNSLVTYYVPLVGSVSYTAFSIHIFNPNFLASIFPRGQHVAANVLLFNAHLGSGLFLYGTKHLAVAPTYYRLMYSIYGSVIFNFGSILLWALTKVVLPDSLWIRAIFALSASLTSILIGKEYVLYVDSQIAALAAPPPPPPPKK